MRIVCPTCAAAYDVPDAMLAGRPRAVRCARCGNEWTPPAGARQPPHEAGETLAGRRNAAGSAVAPEVESNGRIEPRLNPLRGRPEPRAPLPMFEDLPPPDDDEDEDEERKGGGAVAIAAWALTALILAGIGGAAVAWREDVMAAWPPSQLVFAAVGLR